MSSSPAFLILLATAIVAGVVSVLLWRRRTLPGGLALALMMVGVTVWALAAAIEAASTSLSLKILWSKFEYVGSGSTLTFYVLFALQRSGSKIHSRSKRALALWLLPIVNVTLAFTNDWHGWLWTGFEIHPTAINRVVYHHGPAFVAMVAGLFVYGLVGSALLFRRTIRSGLISKRQGIAVLAAALMPILGGLLYVLHPSWLGGINVTPMSLGLSGLVFAVSVLGLRHFDIAPVARDALFEAMDDGVLVLNADSLLVDINPAACRLLDATLSCLGKPAEEVLARWPGLLGYCSQFNVGHFEVCLSSDPLRVIEARLTPIIEGESAGVIIVLRAVTARVHDQRRLQEAHDQLQSQVAEIRRLQESVREQAVHDALTGLFNRRYLEETLPRELASAKRRSAPMAVILLDVDHFKTVNDTLGHHVGDQTLQQLATLLDESTREGDIACRYGGDEFVLLLPDTALNDALDKAEALRSACASLAHNGLPGITISLGVACLPEHGDEGSRLLIEADRALYRAKNSGRNRVCSG